MPLRFKSMARRPTPTSNPRTFLHSSLLNSVSLVSDKTVFSSSSCANDVLCPPGHVIHADFRNLKQKGLDKSNETLDLSDTAEKRKLRVVQFNIERGYQLPKIISILRDVDADILCLQELDIKCERSNSVNCFEAIAKALGLNAVFVNEFIELYSEKRKPRDQGGGIHGNAIMTKLDIKSYKVIDHKYQPLNWSEAGENLGEPRIGKRYSLKVSVTHQLCDDDVIDVYSVHLEPFTGILGRLAQFSEILQEIKRPSSSKYVIVGGDLNTLSHGAARFFTPAHGDNNMRFRTFGWSEGEWWHEHILKNWTWSKKLVHDEACFSGCASQEDVSDLIVPYYDNPEPAKEDKYQELSLPPCLSHLNLLNPGLIPTYPWTTITFKFIHRHIYSAKLDWLLLRHLSVSKRWLANDDFSASDHKAIVAEVDVEPDPEVWREKLISSYYSSTNKRRLSALQKQLEEREEDEFLKEDAKRMETLWRQWSNRHPITSYLMSILRSRFNFTVFLVLSMFFVRSFIIGNVHQ